MSIVNHTYQHVFIHVPKTGGSSIERMPFVGGNGHQAILDVVAPSEYWKWAFVRNPYERLLSFHCAVWQYPNAQLRQFIPNSFEEFIISLPLAAYPAIHLRTQVSFLYKGTELGVDFVGRYENLDRDWHVVTQKILGDDRLVPLGRVYATQHPPWQQVYTPSMLEIVNQLYWCDFKAFDYRISSL